MKYEVHYSKRFEKLLQRVKQLQAFKAEKLKEVIKLLALGEELQAKYKDHTLQGDMRVFRRCHLAIDILLIYEIDNDILILILANIGIHSSAFK